MQERLHNAFAYLPRTARLMVVLCLWMGTGGILHHTDDLGGMTSLRHRPSVGYATPAAPPDDCAACEWTQGLQTGPSVACSVVVPFESLTPLVSRLPMRFHAPLLLHRSSRAPPCILS
jgi:hypothetical protein